MGPTVVARQVIIDNEWSPPRHLHHPQAALWPPRQILMFLRNQHPLSANGALPRLETTSVRYSSPTLKHAHPCPATFHLRPGSLSLSEHCSLLTRKLIARRKSWLHGRHCAYHATASSSGGQKTVGTRVRVQAPQVVVAVASPPLQSPWMRSPRAPIFQKQQDVQSLWQRISGLTSRENPVSGLASHGSSACTGTRTLTRVHSCINAFTHSRAHDRAHVHI